MYLMPTCSVTKLVTSNSSCNASEVFHIMVYFQSFLSHWAWKETPPSTLSSWKNVILNSIYHYKYMLPSENQILLQRQKPRGRGKKKEGKIIPSDIANFKYDTDYFCCYFEYSSMHASVAYFQQIPEVLIKLFRFYYCSADTNRKLDFGLDCTTFGHAK